jgi:hypothetical protein
MTSVRIPSRALLQRKQRRWQEQTGWRLQMSALPGRCQILERVTAQREREVPTSGYTSPKAPGGGGSNRHPNIRPLNLSRQEQADLVAFLRNGLTDPRVACDRAPFDHPSLQLTNGHAGDAAKVLSGSVRELAKDEFLVLPAVGAKGLASGKCLRNDDGTPVRPAMVTTTTVP